MLFMHGSRRGGIAESVNRGEISLRPRSRVAAQRISPRASITLASGAIFLALAISLGPAKPDFHIPWHAPAIEIPAIGDFDQQLAQKYFLLPTLPDGDATPMPEPMPAPAAQGPAGPLAPAMAAVPSAPAAAPAPTGAAQPIAQSLAAQFAGRPGDTASAHSAFSAAVEQIVKVEKGDTLMSVLTDANISKDEAHAAIIALSGFFSPRALKPGQPIKLTLASDDPTEGGSAAASQQQVLHLVALTLEPSVERQIELTRDQDGGFNVQSKDLPLDVESTRAAGIIRSSLFEAGQADGVPVAIMTEVIHAFSYDVDFQRDLQPGDRFEIVYDRYLNDAGDLAKTGNIAFAALTLSGREMKLYRYGLPDGRVEWFNPKGDSARKALLRTPVEGAKITSGFGMRVHPILGYSLMHKGVDFGAPTGTPIFAAGDGVIAQIGPFSGYGNYIRIKHNATYATAYGHISRFAAGLRAGSRVRQGQVIAYVGMTGRATGPHLHFEVLADGRQINPQSLKLPTGEKLQGTELKGFLSYVAKIDRQRRDLAQKALVAN
jgi:murein DD-endopeptidase MepM/ murein hydrolase activator NlpD